VVRACDTYREVSYADRLLVRKPEGKTHLRYLFVDGKMILKWILNMM